LLVAVLANSDAVGVTVLLPPPKSRLSSILLLCSPSSSMFHRVSPIQLERGDGEGCSRQSNILKSQSLLRMVVYMYERSTQLSQGLESSPQPRTAAQSLF
jgi:hypothetical protein